MATYQIHHESVGVVCDECDRTVVATIEVGMADDNDGRRDALCTDCLRRYVRMLEAVEGLTE